ncbi:hypothetical protein ACFFX1_11850 [Dactylosporangium sucinum]|uniref:Uncharacterized protein n=1 Tax=Dactylosporangium sucinum TaxID=1424081 RepID=A0A917TLJ8_9ACTN|nr:hypothetical protein [Dactylosporangium sucinum]GGM27724.1 hypothetical protein GCM10007977_031200 [Dactylosporangium sucinum]
MNTRAMARQHTTWCARNHSCGATEHRSEPYRANHPGLGSLVMTRAQTADGRQYAEIRLNVPLASEEPAARRQLHTALTELYHLLRYFRHIGRRAA